MSDITTIKDDKHTYITDGSGTIAEGKFTVTGNWKKNRREIAPIISVPLMGENGIRRCWTLRVKRPVSIHQVDSSHFQEAVRERRVN